MVIFEYILAVKEPKFSHFKGDEMVFVPGYRIRREKVEADNLEDATIKIRKIKNSIDDCFTQSTILSVSDKLGSPIPGYDPF